ncbi:MAG: glycerophosphodiester phosphodiesterase family protein [Thermoleophilia bacterium]
MNFEVQAHRGARGLGPRNTLESFRRALAAGVTNLELDVGLSRDGVVVVSHERAATRLECTGAHVGKLWKDLDLHQIRTLERGTGERFATLDEVVELVEPHDVGLVIEAKIDPTRPAETATPAEVARRIVETIDTRDLAARCVVQSFDWRVIVESRWLCPELRTTALATRSTVRPGSPWTGGLPVRSRSPFNGEVVALAFLAGAHAIGPHHGLVNPKLIREAHAAGLRVVPWTVNRHWTMHTLVDLGVDGIVTDRPGRLRDVLAVRGFELPPPVADELARAA